MRRHQALSFAAALALWAGAANATPPERPAEAEHAPGLPSLAANAGWIAVEARNHATGISGPAAVLFGVAFTAAADRASTTAKDKA